MNPAEARYSGHNTQLRLSRLVDSGRCKATSSKEYQAELKRLVSESSAAKDLRVQSELFGALSAEVRLKMMYALMERELCECEIMVALDLTQPTASHHLAILERTGLVTKEKRGKWVFYKASEGGIKGILGWAGPATLSAADQGGRARRHKA